MTWIADQCVVVEGKFSAAIYQLGQGTIQRIHKDVAEALTSSLSVPTELEGVMDVLVKRGFRRSHSDGSALGWHDSKFLGVFSIARCLSFELSDASDSADEFVIDVLEEIAHLSVQSVIFVASSRQSRTIESTIERLPRDLGFTPLTVCWRDAPEVSYSLPAHHPGGGAVLVAESDSNRSFGLRSSANGLYSRSAGEAGARACQDLCLVNALLYSLLRHTSESFGCLHFDRERAAYPAIDEVHIRISRDQWDNVLDLLWNEDIRRYWMTGKNERDKCKDCELRFACMNTLANRSDAANLHSAPANCARDLMTGSWE